MTLEMLKPLAALDDTPARFASGHPILGHFDEHMFHMRRQCSEYGSFIDADGGQQGYYVLKGGPCIVVPPTEQPPIGMISAEGIVASTGKKWNQQHD